MNELNKLHSSKQGNDLFKATNKTAIAQAEIGKLIKSYDDYKKQVENLYFLFWDGPGSKLIEKPDSFKDVNTLRTEEEHDVDHGKLAKVKTKKLKHGDVFKKYFGLTSPVIAAPAQFCLL